MKVKTFVLGYALALALLLFAQHRPAPAEPAPFSTVIDLTHEVSEKTPNWEGTQKSPLEVRQLGHIEKDGYFSRYVCLPEHFGTHVDAPAHFSQGRWTVDQIPPRRLIGPLVVLDVSGKVRGNPDYQVTVEDVADWEQVNGQVPPGAIVMARTGWSQRWSSMKDYRNTDAHGIMHFPGFLPDTAHFLVQARGIVALGIDTLGVDYGPSTTFPVHKYTSTQDVYHIENVANLSQAPEAGGIAIVAPAKLQGGSGGPVRVLALVR